MVQEAKEQAPRSKKKSSQGTRLQERLLAVGDDGLNAIQRIQMP